MAAAWLFLTMAKSGCNCLSERISLARVAFEQNVHLVELFFVLVLLAFSYLLYRVKWTAARFVSIVLAFAAGYVAWCNYIAYAMVDPDLVRWLPIPVTALTAAPYSEICRVWVFPVTTCRFSTSFFTALFVFAFLEVICRLWKKRQKALAAAAERMVKLDA